jgi:hypothetical protein
MEKYESLQTDAGPSDGANPVHPLLTTFAVERSDVSELPGRYCSQRNVWVLDGPEGPVPIVAGPASEVFTPLTKVKGERADPEVSALLEISTKTAAPLERDDTSPRDLNVLLELLTKTEARPERDDR